MTGNGDPLDEPNETYNVNLAKPTTRRSPIGSGSGRSPTMTSRQPGDQRRDGHRRRGGTVDATFTVSLGTVSGRTVTVSAALANNTASPRAITWARRSASRPARRRRRSPCVNGDVLDEANETFAVNLSNAVNATIADKQGVGTINDDDATPGLSINDVTVTEGDCGHDAATFTSASRPQADQTVTVHSRPADGTATSPAPTTPRPAAR